MVSSGRIQAHVKFQSLFLFFSFPISFSHFLIFLSFYLFILRERERECMSRVGAEREGERESEHPHA